MGSAVVASYSRRGTNLGADELSDESLLEQFLNGEESDSQEAFRDLVERHGPMVLGICRHVLEPASRCGGCVSGDLSRAGAERGLDSQSQGPGWLASRSGPSNRGQGTCQRGPTTYSRKAGCGDVAPSNRAEQSGPSGRLE